MNDSHFDKKDRAASSQPTAAQTEIHWWGRIDLLWWLFVPLCVVWYALLLPMGPNDLWYHARAGREIVALGHIPNINTFSDSPPWVTPQTPYFFQSWLSDWLLFQILRAWGLSGVTIARALLLGATWCILLIASLRRVGRIAPHIDGTRAARIVCGGAMWAFLMSCNNFDTRPQMFSLPFFGIWTLFIFEWPFLTRVSRGRWLIGLSVLMAIWVNLHGAFFTGLILLGILASGELVTRLLVSRANWVWLGSALNARAIWGIVGAVALAACVNLRGPGIYLYVRDLATNQTGQKYIQEWQAPDWSLAEWNSLIFGIAPICVLLLVIYGNLTRHKVQGKYLQDELTQQMHELDRQILNRWGVRGSELLIALALLIMALRDKRAILWFGLFFAPLWSALYTATFTAERAAIHIRSTQSHVAVSKGAQIFNAILALILCASLILALPQFKAQFDWPPEFRARFAPTPSENFPRGFAGDAPLLMDRSTPVEAVQWLRAHRTSGRVWHDMGFGSYIMWAMATELRPMADPRVELYPSEFWEDYARLSAGATDAPQVLAARGFSCALLDPHSQQLLIKRLQAAHWRTELKTSNFVLLTAPSDLQITKK